MAPIVQVILQGADRTGPAFQSARANLAAFISLNGQAAQSFTGAGAASSRASVQITQGTAVARAGITTLGSASGTTANRVQNLTDRLSIQRRTLDLYGMVLDQTRNKQGATTVQIDRATLAFDRQATSIRQTERELGRLQTQGGRSTPGMSGGGLSGVGGLGSALGGINSAMGTLGVFLGAREIVQFGMDAGASANRLEDTKVTLKGLAGTTQDYNQIVSAATSNQRLFGGSLETNLSGMQSLALVARSSKVDVNALNTVLQQLTFKSPEQGSAGAMIALNEVLTGKGAASTRSLQMRYELPANMLKEIERAKDPAAKIKALNKALEDYGITSDAINKRLDNTSQAYRDLGIAADYAKTKVGGYLALAGAPGAKWLANVLSGVNDTAPGLDQYQTGSEKAAAALGMGPRKGASGFGGAGVFVGSDNQLNMYSGIVGAGATAEQPPVIISPSAPKQASAGVALAPSVPAAPVSLPPQARFAGFGPSAPQPTVINIYPQGIVHSARDLADYMKHAQRDDAYRNGTELGYLP